MSLPVINATCIISVICHESVCYTLHSLKLKSSQAEPNFFGNSMNHTTRCTYPSLPLECPPPQSEPQATRTQPQ